MPWIAAAEERADALARPQGTLERPPGGGGPRGRTQRERHMPDRALAVDAPAGREAQVSDTRNHLDEVLVVGQLEGSILDWRRLIAWGRERGAAFSQPDLFIAAIARLHDLRVVTRNVADFERAGVRVLNPWEYRVE